MENSINEIILKAYNILDVSILEPVLSENLAFSTYQISNHIAGKKECLEFFTQDFRRLSEVSKDSYNTDIVEYKGNKRVAFHTNGLGVVFDIDIEDDKISRLALYPYPSFSFENFYNDFGRLFRISYTHLNNYLCRSDFKRWTWLQTSAPEIRFQDLCIAYDTHVLSIIVGLYNNSDDMGERFFVDQQELQNLLRESDNNNLTPCLFLIDPDGNPHYDGINLIDARTLVPIDLNNLSDNSQGKMSQWEIANLGVAYACEYLNNMGCTDINYCDVLEINPKIFFNYNGHNSYAVVRSVPNGLADQKIVITKDMLANLSEFKGYFIDVRMNSLFGGTGMFDDKFLYRGILFAERYEGKDPICNLVHNDIELIEIEKAINESDCIEVISNNNFNSTTIKDKSEIAAYNKAEGISLLTSMKRRTMSLINCKCGLHHVPAVYGSDIYSIKISDTLYCNMKEESIRNQYPDKRILIGKDTDLLILVNALGMSKIDFKIKLGLIDKIMPDKKITKRYLDRGVADDFYITWMEDLVDEQSGEVCTIERKEKLLEEGSFISDYDIIEYLANHDRSLPLLLYKRKYYYYNDRCLIDHMEKHKDMSADEAIKSITMLAPHLLPLLYVDDRSKLLSDIIKASKNILAYHPCENFKNTTHSKGKFNKLVEQFFDLKIKHVRSCSIVQSRFWKQMEKFLISNGIPENDAVTFAKSFCFIFSDLQ